MDGAAHDILWFFLLGRVHTIFFRRFAGELHQLNPHSTGGGHDFFVIQYGKRESVDFVRVCDRF